MQPTAVFLPGGFHGQRSLPGCSPQGGEESDTTERLSTALRNTNKVVELYLWPDYAHTYLYVCVHT